jgi:hypothetical protein
MTAITVAGSLTRHVTNFSATLVTTSETPAKGKPQRRSKHRFGSEIPSSDVFQRAWGVVRSLTVNLAENTLHSALAAAASHAGANPYDLLYAMTRRQAQNEDQDQDSAEANCDGLQVTAAGIIFSQVQKWLRLPCRRDQYIARSNPCACVGAVGWQGCRSTKPIEHTLRPDRR